jgi:hypothetical protein
MINRILVIIILVLSFSGISFAAFDLRLGGGYGSLGPEAGLSAEFPLSGNFSIPAQLTYTAAGNNLPGGQALAYPLVGVGTGLHWDFLRLEPLSIYLQATINGGYIPTLSAAGNQKNAAEFLAYPTLSLGTRLFGFLDLSFQTEIFASDNIQLGGYASLGAFGLVTLTGDPVKPVQTNIIAQTGKKPETNVVVSTKSVATVDAELPTLDFNLPRGSSVFGSNTVAVIIGNRDYQNGIPNVDYALNDAASVRDCLVKTFGVPAENILMMSNASQGRLNSYFGTEEDYKGQLYRQVVIGKYDLIVYYSGHGAPAINTGKGYLVPVDADVMSIDKSGYGISTLFDNVRKLKEDGYLGRVMIVFDSCFSGDSPGGRILKQVSPVAIKLDNPLLAMKDAITLFSSTGNEVSSWYPDKGHGMFTYFLLKGLSGEAGKNAQGGITLGSLRKYMAENVNKWAVHTTAQEQHPQLTAADDDEALVRLK